MSPRVSPDMIPAKSTRKQEVPAYAHHSSVPNAVSSPCTISAIAPTPAAAAALDAGRAVAATTRTAAARLTARALPAAAAIAPRARDDESETEPEPESELARRGPDAWAPYKAGPETGAERSLARKRTRWRGVEAV